MSEQLHNPEKQTKPLYDNCNGCEQQYELTPRNTVGRAYEKQPECNFIYCACPHCNFRTRIFCDQATIDRAIALGINISQDEANASEIIYGEWIELKGIELPKTHELTHRHEKLMGQFATSLATTPDEHLYDLIVDTGYNKPYPQRWT